MENGTISVKWTAVAAEQQMLAAADWCLRMPDRERVWLRSGERGNWPQVIHDAMDAYGWTEPAPPSPSRTRRMLAQADLMMGIDGHREPVCNVIPVGHRSLVGQVLVRKLVRQVERLSGDDWAWIYATRRGLLWRANLGRVERVTADDMRNCWFRSRKVVAEQIEVLDPAERAVLGGE